MDWHHPILSCAESKRFEDMLFAGSTSAAAEAMERAGAALGRAILEDLGVRLQGNEVQCLVLLGKGHNAGDALIATRFLLDRISGMRVDVFPVLGVSGFDGSVQRWWERVIGDARVRLLDDSSFAEISGIHYNLSLDGVFGMQFRPPLRDVQRALFRMVNSAHIGVRVAVDLPSGLCDYGAICDDDGVLRADFTYATGLLKNPLVERGNLPFVGRLRYLDLGFFKSGGVSSVSSNLRVVSSDVVDRCAALRPVVSDKRTYGHLLIVAGSRQMPGALLMATKAASRSGVGLLTVVAPESVCSPLAAQVPEAMWLPWPETENGGLSLEGFSILRRFAGRMDAVLMGPGCGTEPETQALMDEVIELFDPVPVILDADALTVERVGKLKAMARAVVMTPHEGEFRRIAGIKTSVTLDDASLLEFSAGYHPAAVLLKGPVSRLCDGKSIFHFPFGNPILARGGSGDLLAGLIAGKVAASKETLLMEAVAQGVAIHGRAADRLFSKKEETHIQTTDILNYLNLY